MAILQHNDLAFELRFLDYEDGDFLLYEIGFLCRDEPLLNPATLPAQPTVRTGYFIASENIGDRFIAFLDWVLENDKPDYWEPLEEEVRIALAPGYSFPFSSDYLDGPGAGERNDANGNPLPRPLWAFSGGQPGDMFTLLARKNYHYGGQGAALAMNASRADLLAFSRTLKAEYRVFRERHPELRDMEELNSRQWRGRVIRWH